ncbi:major facilitator superfamily domain-containing protein [Hysterangium stoloniferum]|nr:major facilitator superfamily domain-containing protein [Hysterangium stoloniferum]
MSAQISIATLTTSVKKPEKSEKSTIQDLEADARVQASQPLKSHQKVILLALLCSAQFFDIFSAVSVIIALPDISNDLHFQPGALQWIVSAYTLTFAASFLLAGRLTDIYASKPIFCIGYLMVGIFSILCAVSVHPIMLLVFRAIQGIGAAFTFPSALSMIIQYFPDTKEKNRALGLFGGFGAIGNVVGFILGGVLTAQVNWRWIFYLVAIIVTPFSLLSFLVIPKRPSQTEKRHRKLDWQGVGVLSAGLILFVYALSDANDVGYGKPRIIVTLVFSVIFIIGFFFIERVVEDPAVPPKTWTAHNFLPLFLYCSSLYWFINGIEIQLIQIFQDLWGWSALLAAIHCLPLGITAGSFTYITPMFALYIPRRVLLIAGQVLMAIAVVLFAFVDTPDKYWSYLLPGMMIGAIGVAIAYVAANIFIMADAPEGEEGVIGAMMNTAFQLGATVGLASGSYFEVYPNPILTSCDGSSPHRCDFKCQ